MEVLAVSLGLLFFGFLGVVRPLINKHLYREYQAEVAHWQRFQARWLREQWELGVRWAEVDLLSDNPQGCPLGASGATIAGYASLMKNAPVKVDWNSRKAKRWAESLQKVS